MANFYDTLLDVLKADKRFFTEEGTFLRNKVYECAMNMDTDLIRLLLSNIATKAQYFKDVDSVLVFDKVGFGWVVNNRQFLPDSYTRYKNRIGLTDIRGDLISTSNDVVLSFPYKDCVLVGGQTKDDQKRDEVFFNSILAPDEVDRLLYPKVFVNARRYVVNGTEENVTFDDGDNLIIQGNNLLAISSLLKRYERQVKCIYIDPPYNTGSDSFGYNDKFNHSTWLVFMKNRLEIAKKLLKSDGIIFVHCDDSEQAYLKVLLDDIFGRDMYVNTITVEAKGNSGASGGGEDKRLKKNVEFILCYAMSGFERFYDFYKKVPLETYLAMMELQGINNHYVSIYTDLGEKSYYKTIKDGSNQDMIIYKHAGYKTTSVSRIARDENLTILEVYKKYFDRICTTENAQTSIRTRVLEATDADDTLYSVEYYPVSGKNKGNLTTIYFVGIKKRLISWFNNLCVVEDVNIFKREKIGTHWGDLNWNNVTREGGVTLPKGQKPEDLLRYILSLATQEKDLVLDFFAGAGTCGAVAHKMGRKYILVEQMDYIHDLPESRLINVIAGDQTGISKSVNWQGGGSFVYCEIAECNQKFVSEVQTARTDNELFALLERIIATGYINYKVNPADINEAITDFEALSIEDKKRFIMELLDKNMLYVNLCDLNDEEYAISDADKAFTHSFYGLGE
jgi:adenine-specific DNA-methyltransferase